MRLRSLIWVSVFVAGCEGGYAEQQPPVAESHQELLGCSTASQCTGGLLCDIGKCVLGMCLYVPLLGCSDSGGGDDPGDPGQPTNPDPPLIGTCNSNTDCGNNNGCLLSVCIQALGLCVDTGLIGCEESDTPCTSNAECEAASPLGVGLCIDGSCVLSVGVSGPGGDGDGDGDGGGSGPSVDLLCNADTDCEDNDPCTADVCATALGLCGHIPIPNCSAPDPNDPGDGSGGGSGSGTGAGSSSGHGAGDDTNENDPGTSNGATDSDDPTNGLDPDGEAKDGEALRGGGCSASGAPTQGSWWVLFLVGLSSWFLWFRRRRSAGAAQAAVVGAACLVASTVTGTAHAQGFSLDSNSVPVAPEDMLWTERAAIPMDHLSLFGRAMFGYANDPLVVEDLATGARTTAIESQSSLYLSGGIALLDRFHLAAMVPLYLQKDGAAASVEVDGFSLGNPALEARANILDTSAPFELGLAGTVTVPVGNSDQLVADEAVSGNPRILLGKSWGEEARSFVALNGGVRFRRSNSLGNVEAGHELTFGAGLNWAFWGPLAATAEVGGRTTFADAFQEDVTPFGVLVGLRWAPTSYSVAAGFGPGLNEGVGNPKYRILAEAGARWRPAKDEEEPAPEPAPPTRTAPKAEPAAPPAQEKEDPCAEEAQADPSACPHLDADGDGIPNGKDACPTEAEDLDGFQDADGCPDPDNDGDGIPDEKDQCPLDAETFNGVDDEDGCPDKVRVSDGMITTLEPIFFETNSTKIQKRSEPLLAEIARVIRAREDLGTISIEGHTDSRGDDDYNLRLSQGRAESVRDFLIESGVSAHRLVARGFGETRPVASGDSPAAHAANRRVEFRLIPNGASAQ